MSENDNKVSDSIDLLNEIIEDSGVPKNIILFICVYFTWGY